MRGSSPRRTRRPRPSTRSRSRAARPPERARAAAARRAPCPSIRCAARASLQASSQPLSCADPRRTVGGVRDPITALERAIRSLPAATQAAMLDGIRAHPIVVGAYTDGRGGICPMLAAHRHGGRVTLLAFSRAWDAFARTKRVRRATARELRVLEDLLLASLEDSSEFAQAIAEHRAAIARRPPEIRARRLTAPRRSGRRGAAGAAARTAW